MYQFSQIAEEDVYEQYLEEENSDVQVENNFQEAKNEYKGLYLSDGEEEANGGESISLAHLGIPQQHQELEKTSEQSADKQNHKNDDQMIQLTSDKTYLQSQDQPLTKGLRRPLTRQELRAQKKRKQLMINGKVKLVKRVHLFLQDILSQNQPLNLPEIVEILKGALHIGWEREQITVNTVHRFILGHEDLRQLYKNMINMTDQMEFSLSPIKPDEAPKPEVTKFCKTALQLMQFKKQNELYFILQCEFPLDFARKKKNPKKTFFRGVIGSNYLTFWDFLDEDVDQKSAIESLKYIFTLIAKRKQPTTHQYIVISKRFYGLYKEAVEYGFSCGFNLIGIPETAANMNPAGYWMRDLRYHAKKHQMKSMEDLKMFLHYEHNRLIDRIACTRYIMVAKRNMTSEIKKGIEVPFSESMKLKAADWKELGL